MYIIMIIYEKTTVHIHAGNLRFIKHCLHNKTTFYKRIHPCFKPGVISYCLLESSQKLKKVSSWYQIHSWQECTKMYILGFN